MHYKRQEATKYNHYTMNEKVLLGVPKNISYEDVVIFADNPIQYYGKEIYAKLLQLEHRDRNIILSAIEEWEIMQEDKVTFNGLYWDIVLDFILFIYDWTTYDIAKEIYKLKKRDYNSAKQIYDAIEKMRNNKARLKEEGREIVNIVCAWFRITKDIFSTGRGILYHICKQENYYPSQIVDYCRQYPEKKQIRLKQMISDITEEPLQDIIEVPLQIAVERKILGNREYEIVDIIIKKMLENRS